MVHLRLPCLTFRHSLLLSYRPHTNVTVSKNCYVGVSRIGVVPHLAQGINSCADRLQVFRSGGLDQRFETVDV